MHAAAAYSRPATRRAARKMRLATVGATCAAALLAGVGTLVWSAPAPARSGLLDNPMGELLEAPACCAPAAANRLRFMYEAHAIPGISIKPYWGMALAGAGANTTQTDADQGSKTRRIPCAPLNDLQAERRLTDDARGSPQRLTEDLHMYADTLAQGLAWMAHSLDIARLSLAPANEAGVEQL